MGLNTWPLLHLLSHRQLWSSESRPGMSACEWHSQWLPWCMMASSCRLGGRHRSLEVQAAPSFGSRSIQSPLCGLKRRLALYSTSDSSRACLERECSYAQDTLILLIEAWPRLSVLRSIDSRSVSWNAACRRESYRCSALCWQLSQSSLASWGRVSRGVNAPTCCTWWLCFLQTRMCLVWGFSHLVISSQSRRGLIRAGRQHHRSRTDSSNLALFHFVGTGGCSTWACLLLVLREHMSPLLKHCQAAHLPYSSYRCHNHSCLYLTSAVKLFQQAQTSGELSVCSKCARSICLAKASGVDSMTCERSQE